jgi:ubiquinone/menaquinone biosynthesis C-methylase UbiE
MTDIWQRFDHAAATYEAASLLQQQSAHALLNWLHHSHTVQGQVWLDAGCGTGWMTRRLAAQGARVWAIDRALAMLDGLRHEDDIQIICSDLRQLPMPDGMLDGVISNFVLHWLGVDILPELLRVVRPAGELWLAIPVQGSLADVQQRFDGFPVFDFLPEQAWLDATHHTRQDHQIITVRQTFAHLHALLQALRQMGGDRTARPDHQPNAPQLRHWLMDRQPVDLDFRVLMLRLRVPIVQQPHGEGAPDDFAAWLDQRRADPRFE